MKITDYYPIFYTEDVEAKARRSRGDGTYIVVFHHKK